MTQYRRLALVAAPLLALAGAGYLLVTGSRGPDPNPQIVLEPLPPEATSQQVHRLCGSCHAYPPPDSFPRAFWRKEVRQGYAFFHDSDLRMDFPPLESVVRYYEHRAPLALPPLKVEPSRRPPLLGFTPQGYPLPQRSPHPGVTNVNLVSLLDRRRLDVLVCDARLNEVLVHSPYESTPSWRSLGRVAAPAHAEVIDLDGDGIKDVLVASLGSFFPTDERCGSVVWLRGQPGGGYAPHTLLKDVGRVADVQAADFRGVGKLDLIVAVFGWRDTGEIYYLENRTTDWSRPTFVARVLDERHGTINVPVGDLNGDGRPDFVALISQEHEAVVAFLNEGDGKFRKETIYTAPHPAYGCSGIQLADINGDGCLDVLLSNGDVMDPPPLLKPYHGIQWLENPGRGKAPFRHHPLTAMYGAARAVAADVDGDGDLDIVGVSFLPPEDFPEREALSLDAVILLEQTAPGQFARHSLARTTCDHFTCAVGDVFGTGRPSLVLGNYCLTQKHRIEDAVSVWRNDGVHRR